ncbi:uncharacterized protein PHALS_00188 [Plasmopara halstedii]|uniref:Uncharacterized protein n=1 Tax=Plasmopara halstedii TaxID=4781 RepID=A0A0N7L3H1_PLAHL|nr:uncharacterized protein PHALS_00188 [Plasmopara halstedii]CEG35859.1 hypothetical protein PHALS_00188 [Plasmopara halstedii]|eukprot:XP_024572228.1 hypothetical protein PHALS_00188 [Plasmopara halstedii]
MGILKQGQSMKSNVVPLSDDGSNSRYQNKINLSCPGSRGVSFTTARGKIWLILVINLSIIIMFIFVSSSCLLFLNRDIVVNYSQEQEKQPVTPTNKLDKKRIAQVATQILIW